MIEDKKESKPPASAPAASAEAVAAPTAPNLTSVSLSEPAEQNIPNSKGYSLEEVLTNSEFVCLTNETMLFRLDNNFYFMQFQAGSIMRIRTFESVVIQNMLDCCLLEQDASMIVLAKDRLLQLQSRGGRVIQRTLMDFPMGETGRINPYKKVSAPDRNVVFLLTTDNRLEFHSIEGDMRLRLVGATELHIDREHYRAEIGTLMIEKRSESGKYLATTVCSYSLHEKFERECLYVLELELKAGRLECQPFEVVTVELAGYLQVRTFVLCHQATREFLELSLNNEILVVCRFINRYMIWECIYHKKIKEEAKTRSFGLLRHNLFYVVEKFLLELYQFNFVEDKKNECTIIKVELTQLTPDQNGGVRPPLGYSFYEEGGFLEPMLLNCTVSDQRISLFFRCSFRCSAATKIDQMVALVQQHKQLEPELDKTVAFLAGKMRVSEQDIYKEIWQRWPRVLQRNSHSIRKLIQVADPHYIEGQMVELLRKSNLKLDLVEDILVKCKAMHRKQLLRDFNARNLRRYVKGNFKVKKVRLYMLTCRTKEISIEDWKQLKHSDMDKEIKSYFPEFRKVDLELALGLFPYYFLSHYRQSLCYAFGLIKDVVYFVSNFNFLFPTKSRMDVWELNMDRREFQLTHDKLEKIYTQSKKKEEPFQACYLAAQKEAPKYMINNDVYTTKLSLKSFDQAYHLFFDALVESSLNITLELAQKTLTILSELNSIREEKRVHLSCIIDLFFAVAEFHEEASLLEMFELTPEALFQRLLELGSYELFMRIAKPVFGVLEHHGLSESFEKYLNSYMCRKTVFNKHFTEILVASRQLSSDELESVLETMLDCIYYSMNISHASEVQNYIEEYFLVEVRNDLLRQKILRLEDILAHEEYFLAIDSNLKLIEIEVGEEVFHRKIFVFLRDNGEALQRGDVNASAFEELMKDMQFLRKVLYGDYTESALFNRMLHQAFERLPVWKHFVGTLLKQDFPTLNEESKRKMLDDMIQQQRNLAYQAGSVEATTKLMHELIEQYNDANFSRIEGTRLELIGLFESFGLTGRLQDAVNIDQPKVYANFESFVDSESFLKTGSASKNRFIELLAELSGNGSSRKKIEKLRVRQLEQACEQALENRDYTIFLECLQEHLTRSKPQDFDVDFKILWIRFIGQLIHQGFWSDLGIYILRKCLYLIPDFKEAMNEFFAFLTRENEDIFLGNPIEHLKLRTTFLRKKGREWTVRRIEVIEAKVKKSIASNNILEEFMFRHLLVAEHRLAFAFLKSVLKHVDIENIYKICIICLESEYFTAKLEIINLLIEVICLQFSRDYEKDVGSHSQLNQTDLLRLILKLRPNAKDEESRNKLTFFEGIITNSLKLKAFYEKLGDDRAMGSSEHELQQSGGTGVQIETILQSLLVFNESVIPILRGASGHGIDQNAHPEQLAPLRIGEELVESFDGDPR